MKGKVKGDRSMERDELDQLLSELRAVRAERGAVEAKRAAGGLPSTTWQSLSALANTDGGILLLGVDENGGAFDVNGVGDAAAIMRDLQSACAELEPPLRPPISIIAHDTGAVVVAEVAPIPRSERPCHRRADGPPASYIRVGDADQRLTDAEIAEMTAARQLRDLSRRLASEHAALAEDAVADFGERVRAERDRYAELDDAAVLRTYAAIEDGHPTVAGLLALGEEPAAVTPAARIAYRRMPGDGAPVGARYEAAHLEGRIGELLDQAAERLRRDLRTVQVERGGNLFDELDVPTVALREIIGNALLHRSLTEAQEGSSVAIEVTDQAVEVTSPGALHVNADPALLGVDSISSVRNHALVRICEELRTPSGGRIVENQASGIMAADKACREMGTMPPLFIDMPARFHVVLLRGALDTEAAAQLLATRGVEARPEYIRVVSVARRLQEAIGEIPVSGLTRVVLDARLAARALAPSSPEDGAAVLLQLEDAGVLERLHIRHGSTWALHRDAVVQAEPEPEPEQPRGRRDRVQDVVRAIADSATGELPSRDIQAALGLRSTNSTNRWINRAAERELIEPTTASLYAANRAYRLTQAGRQAARRGT
jgi:ATP-dependent DNA helicase RecG